jgi:hypothetical protein
MKKLLVTLAAVGLIAASATAAPVDRSNTPIFTAEITQGSTHVNPIYSQMSNTPPTFSVSGPVSGGPASADDYDTTKNPGLYNDMFSFRFIGGSNIPNGVVFFTFFNTAFTSRIDSFGVRLPSAGNYIWTITITTPANLTFPDQGIVAMWGDTGFFGPPTQATWFVEHELPTIGTTSPAFPGYTDGSGAFLHHDFEINAIPEPATLAMLGLGVLTLISRKRK